ncbi:hypothetical protein PBRA_001062, partial [Plasmodiophora brassicae]
LADWYTCPAYACRPPHCRCASSRSPVDSPPMFIVLTHDDAVHSFSTNTVLNVVRGLSNPNGCDLPVTWYVSVEYTLPHLVRHVYDMNHEIATHTVHHVGLPDRDEIVGCRNWLRDQAGIPEHELRGFRAPYLMHDVRQRRTLHDNGFAYESSINQAADKRQLFPYTLDHGVAIDCSKGTGPCAPEESYPGMWSVPLWTLPGASNSMDIIGDAYEQYMNEFNSKYHGNRSPLGVFFHSGWLDAHSDQVRRFLAEVTSAHDDVWVVTNWQLIEWMKNPVSAAEYRWQQTRARFCPRSPRGPLPPASGCLHGTWDGAAYRCVCLGEGNPSANGFCRGSSGACDVPKSYADGAFTCDGEPEAPAQPDGPSSTSDETDASHSEPATTEPPYAKPKLTIRIEISKERRSFCADLIVKNAGRQALQKTVRVRRALTGRYAIRDDDSDGGIETDGRSYVAWRVPNGLRRGRTHTVSFCADGRLRT